MPWLIIYGELEWDINIPVYSKEATGAWNGDIFE